MLANRITVQKRLQKLQPGRSTSFGYEPGDNVEAGRTRNLVMSVAKSMNMKVETHKDAKKSTIKATRRSA